MTGFPGWDNTDFFDGWYEINTEGLATIRLSVSDEGIVTCATDTPANRVFSARLLNAESFSIRRRPIVWPWGDTSIQLAAFGQLQLENNDDAYSYLVGADLRDSPVIIQLPVAMAYGSATLINDAYVVATAIFDNASCDNEDVIVVTLKDTLARLDKQLPMRYNPPFRDPGAANRMVPLSLGAIRNMSPLLIDSPLRLFQLGDMQVTNVTAVRDGGAPLDRNATPPQYTPALSGSGLQLDVLTENKMTVDCSTVGAQVVIPGADDVLNGDGDFVTWSGSPAVPDGWTWTDGPGSFIDDLTNADGYQIPPGTHIALLSSAITWFPTIGEYGDQLTTDTDLLEGGKAYRITFKVYNTFTSEPFYGDDGLRGGIQVRTALSNLAADSVSDHNQPIQVPRNGKQSYVYDFRVPDGPNRPLIFIASAAQGGPNAGTPVGIGGGLIYDVKLELLGEYTELPLQGINLEQYFYEILVNRAGEPEDVYNAADLIALDEATQYEFGNHYKDQPNILMCLRDVLDSYCATLYTDSLGALRVARHIDPKDGTPIAVFDESNVVKPIGFAPDNCSNLTTLIGTTRNWDPLTDSDFVTDYLTVPADVRTRYKQTSQFQRTSSFSPAGQYDFARGTRVFDSLLDDPDDGQTEIDRVVSIWSPRVYSDGTVTTGKRRFVTFTALFDDPQAVGSSLQCSLSDIGFGTVVTLNYPRRGFVNTAIEVVGWEIFPFGKKIIIVGFY